MEPNAQAVFWGNAEADWRRYDLFPQGEAPVVSWLLVVYNQFSRNVSLKLWIPLFFFRCWAVWSGTKYMLWQHPVALEGGCCFQSQNAGFSSKYSRLRSDPQLTSRCKSASIHRGASTFHHHLLHHIHNIMRRDLESLLNLCVQKQTSRLRGTN